MSICTCAMHCANRCEPACCSQSARCSCWCHETEANRARTLAGATDLQLRDEYRLWSLMRERASQLSARCQHPYVRDIGTQADAVAGDCRTVLSAIGAEAARRGVSL